MMAADLQGDSSRGAAVGGKRPRGHVHRVMAAANAATIKSLTGLLEEALLHMTANEASGSDCDSIVSRILLVAPSLQSALDGNGGKLSKRMARIQRNGAAHFPRQPQSIGSPRSELRTLKGVQPC